MATDRRRDPLEHQRGRNRETVGCWDDYASHRVAVTALASKWARDCATRLCVLGAGNCNDLDLAVLTRVHREVHLVDVDAEALSLAISRQPPAVRERLVAHASVDITGLWGFALARGGSVDAGELLHEATERAPLDLGCHFDVVVSAAIFTQIVSTVIGWLSQLDPHRHELVLALRAAHFAGIADVLVPGGRGIFVGELLSSDTYPKLASTPVRALPDVMGELIRTGNFFTAMNPFAIVEMLRTHPRLSSRVQGVKIHVPWLWRVGQARTYLAYAISFERR